MGPRGLETDGVQQAHNGIRVKFLYDLWYHAVGVWVAPFVDFAEAQCIDLGIIVLLHVGLVLRDETNA